MIIAKIENGLIGQIGIPGELFPNIAFPSTGPDEQFLIENSCLEVYAWKPHNKETEYLISTQPYIENDIVFIVEVATKTIEQINTELEIKNFQLQQSVVNSTQNRLDNFAKTRNYDGILSACTYATDPNLTFASEGQRAVDLRSNTWATLYVILNEVQTGVRPVPSGFSDIEPELPELSWN